MLQQFFNSSTWRKETVTINPHEVETIDYLDTTPNMFYIINPNVAGLKVGIGSIPRANSFEYKVEANSSEIVGRPEGSTKLYILNDSGVKATITVFSVNKEFDPSILKNMNVVLEGVSLEVGSQITSIIDGLVLPTEDKNGSTVASTLKSILTLLNATGVKEYNSGTILNELKALTSSGNTTLSTLLNKLNTIANNTEKIELNAENVEAIAYDDTQLIALIQGMYLNAREHYGFKHYTFKNNVTDFYQGAPSEPYFYDFQFIFNDSDKVLNVKKNDNIILTILPKEKINNLKLVLSIGEELRIEGENAMFRLAFASTSFSSTMGGIS